MGSLPAFKGLMGSGIGHFGFLGPPHHPQGGHAKRDWQVGRLQCQDF